jgi:hypothetical protein
MLEQIRERGTILRRRYLGNEPGRVKFHHRSAVYVQAYSGWQDGVERRPST